MLLSIRNKFKEKIKNVLKRRKNMKITKLEADDKEYAVVNGAFHLDTARATLTIMNNLEKTNWRLPTKKEISDFFENNSELTGGARINRDCRDDIIAYWTSEFKEHIGMATVYMPQFKRSFYHSQEREHRTIDLRDNPHHNLLLTRERLKH